MNALKHQPAVLTLLLAVVAPAVVQGAEPVPLVYQLGVRPQAAGPPPEKSAARELFDDFTERAGEHSTGNFNSFLDGVQNLDDITPLYWTGKAAEGVGLVTGLSKGYTEYRRDERRHAQLGGFTLARESTKWVAGVVAGTEFSAMLIAGTANAPVLVSIVVIGGSAWAVTTATEVTIEKLFNYFHPQAGALKTQRTGKVDHDVAAWLGSRVGKVRVIHIGFPDAKTAKGVVLPDHFTGAQIREVLRQSQSNMLDRAQELLTGSPSPFGARPKSKDVSLETLGDMIPHEIRTPEQLQAFVQKESINAVRRGLGAGTGETTPEAQSAAFRGTYPYIYRAWLERKKRWERELRNAVYELAAAEVPLTIAPDKPAIDPSQGRLPITVTAVHQLDPRRLIGVRSAYRRLTGESPAFESSTSWLTDLEGGANMSGPWPSRTFFATEPGEYVCEVDHMLELGLPDGKKLSLHVAHGFAEFTVDQAITRVFTAERLDRENAGKVTLRITGTVVEGISDTRNDPAAASEEGQTIFDNPEGVLSDVFRGMFRREMRWKGTFDPKTSTITGTVDVRTGIGTEGPLSDEVTRGRFQARLQENILTGNYSFQFPEADRANTGQFTLREQAPPR